MPPLATPLIFFMLIFLNNVLNFFGFFKKSPSTFKIQTTSLSYLFLNLAYNGVKCELEMPFFPLPPRRETRARHMIN